MLAIGLALVSSALYGTADFLGGLTSRRVAAILVAFWSQAVGTVLLVVLVAASGQSPTAGGVAWGVAAGLFGGSGVFAFYRALAVGTMSIVAPIAACGAILPVVVGLARGEVPGPVVAVGLVAALAGVVLASLAPGTPGTAAGARRVQAIGLAVLAAVAFGAFFALLDTAANRAPDAVLWVTLAARLGSVPLLGLVAVAIVGRTGGLRALGLSGGAPVLGLVAICGIFDTGANVTFTYATTEGELGVVSVLGSLYPVATVLLARAVLAERLRAVQASGVALALTGVVLVSAG